MDEAAKTLPLLAASAISLSSACHGGRAEKLRNSSDHVNGQQQQRKSPNRKSVSLVIDFSLSLASDKLISSWPLKFQVTVCLFVCILTVLNF